MKQLILTFGGIYGGLAVVLGAFGAHALKNKFDEAQLRSFETGVRYQMYHALLLIICGIIFPFIDTSQQLMGWCFVVGIFLFSFSIYGLTLSASSGKKMRFLGPVTPVGGLLLVVGWVLFTIQVVMYASYL